MRCSSHIQLGALLLVLTCLTGWSAVSAEPLRILVPPFKGERIISKVITMTVYLEMIKAFRGPYIAERGVWILYGGEELSDVSHRSAMDAALWPSVSADLVIWGSITQLHDGFVVEPYVTRTPISRKRKVQPEILTARFHTARGEYDVSLANTAAFFDLEPFTVAGSIVEHYENYTHGIPIYPTEHASEPKAYTNDVTSFLEVKENAVRVGYGANHEGWIRFIKLGREDLSMIHFSHGLIRVLRGDWRSAVESFTNLTKFSSLPNGLRVDAHIYLGIARYKLGQSGLEEFRRAFMLNAFDKDAASFLFLGLLLDYYQNRDPSLLAELDIHISKSQILFSETNRWFSDMRQLVAEFRR